MLSKLKPSNLTSEIDYIIQKILSCYQPEKIILFGSFAYGQPSPDSDIDMLIIKETQDEPRDRRIRLRKLVYEKNIEHPFSPLVYTKEEIKQRLEMGDFFIKEIMEKGKVLYER